MKMNAGKQCRSICWRWWSRTRRRRRNAISRGSSSTWWTTTTTRPSSCPIWCKFASSKRRPSLQWWRPWWPSIRIAQPTEGSSIRSVLATSEGLFLLNPIRDWCVSMTCSMSASLTSTCWWSRLRMRDRRRFLPPAASTSWSLWLKTILPGKHLHQNHYFDKFLP